MSKALSIVLIGCGRVAEKHLRAIRFQEKKGRVRLAAVCDRQPDQARTLLESAAGASYSALPIYEDARLAVQAAKADIAVITTPSGSHFKLAEEALAAGAHLFVEKPLAMHSREAERIAAEAEKAGRRLVVGHIYRYFPCVSLLQKDLAGGRFGRVLYGSVQVRWGHGQDYYDQAPWRGTRAADGGVVMNQSVHALDLMQWLLSAGPTAEVRSFCATQSHVMESEDLGLASFRFQGGQYLHYEGSTSGNPAAQEASFYICCEEAEIRAQLYRKKIRFSVLTRAGRELRRHYLARWLRDTWKQDGLGGILAAGNPHQAIYTDFIEAIRDQRPPLADGRAGARAVEMVRELYRACGIDEEETK